MLTSSSDNNTVLATIRDLYSREVYTISGSYLENLVAKDLRTNHEWIIAEAPKRPENVKENYGMNYFSL